jgi:hypothetical protein
MNSYMRLVLFVNILRRKKYFAVVSVTLTVFIMAISIFLTVCIQSRREPANQLFIDDLDYLINMLEENFSLFDFAYHERGVDIHAIGDRVRRKLTTSREISVYGFFALLYMEFFPLMFGDPDSRIHINTGHFRISSPVGSNRTPFFDEALRIMGRGINELQNEGLLSFHGEHEFEQERHLIYEGHSMSKGPYITTAVIEEGKIAYMDIRRLTNPILAQTSQDGQKIFEFYKQIQGFEHLIIDLRRNRGGFVDYFYRFILGPNIVEPVVIDGFHFSVHGGRYAKEATLPFLSTVLTGFWDFQNIVPDRRRGIIPVAELLEENDLPQLNLQHITRMRYAFPIQYRLVPRPVNRTQPEFDGKIWLLIGPSTGSSAHLSSWFSKDTGFATLVGQNTGGNFGGNRVEPTLPNTGFRITFDIYYLTDRYGYGLEAGVTPHYRSRPGMGALETTLALIAEGWSYGD